MTYRNLLLLGLSSIALQGCIAAAALPIVAGGGALVRNGVSDDARSGSRESVAVVNPPLATPAPAAAPTPTPAPALAAAQPAEPVAAAAEPIAPQATPTPAPLASAAPEPVIVATLGDAPQGPEIAPASAPTPAAAAGPAEAAIATPQLPDEPEASAPEAAPPSQAVVVATLPEEPAAAAAEATLPESAVVVAGMPAESESTGFESAPASEAFAAAQVPEQPEATAPVSEPPVASIAEVGLPPEPSAPAPEPAPELAPAPALAAATPGAQPPAAAMPDPVEPAAAAPAAAAVDTMPADQAFVSAEPPVEPPAGPSPEDLFGQPVAGSGYGALANYALRTLGGGLPLPSAMLADPTSLQPIRRDCQGSAPTVVIDLDPAGGVVPIAGPLALNNELSRILADLRLRNVQIAWITDRGPIDARAVRDRLVASGLDPASQDALYVERYPGETKQSRRAALAQTRCVIALAGDERSDFDDLYNFLRDLNDARSLEMMLGNGWFLIPNPVGE